MASGKIANQNIVLYRDVEQEIEAFEAGNPGSRALRYNIGGLGINGYSIISAVIKNHPNSLVMNCKPFLVNGNETGVYLNVYRASGNAYSGGGTAKIRVTYLRN